MKELESEWSTKREEKVKWEIEAILIGLFLWGGDRKVFSNKIYLSPNERNDKEFWICRRGISYRFFALRTNSSSHYSKWKLMILTIICTEDHRYHYQILHSHSSPLIHLNESIIFKIQFSLLNNEAQFLSLECSCN